MINLISDFWQIPLSELLQKLNTSSDGISSKEADDRLEHYGPNSLKKQKRSGGIFLFLSQFKSPIILLLLFAAALSLFLQDSTDAIIIFVIILVSSMLGFFQEYRATNAVKKLLEMVRITSVVIRDGVQKEIPSEEIVPGDIVLLSAGSKIPADCIIIESRDLFVNEAVLTGETFPVEKNSDPVYSELATAKKTNTLFMGTNVISGNSKAVVVKTGLQTEFGKVADRLRFRAPETEFEQGVKKFGYFLTQVTLILVIAIFAINVYLSKPFFDSILFSLALAVGLTPQLLPAIISINLSHGARQMANRKVIVKRLSSIENLGSMNVLCSDKTGTLTEGIVRIKSNLDVSGNESDEVFFYAYLNAVYETGFLNPIDQAIRSYKVLDVSSYKKLDEIPYDFSRKKLTILVSKDNEQIMITKGALSNVLSACSHAKSQAEIVKMENVREQILQKFLELSQQGFRVLGVSYKSVMTTIIKNEDDSDMIFLGFLVLYDPPKAGIIDTINQLKDLGISLKIITGDNKLVAENVAKQIGLINPKILTGQEMRQMTSEAFFHNVNEVDIFSEVEPNQKERIIVALKKTGNVVGFIGDGINDATALHASDVGISVDTAVDVAKEASDIVLLEKNFEVLIHGVIEGRRTFANTIKYVFMATSANFGNMFSMAGASTFLSFLPALPKQILLTNLLTDMPEMTLATDNVDKELIAKPHKFNMKFIRKFMIVFGLLNSVADYATFGVLLYFGSNPDQFRTGWFIENVFSAALVVLAIRTTKPLIKSKPGKYLVLAIFVIICMIFVIPYTILGKEFGFTPISISILVLITIIVAIYITFVEIAKRLFYRKITM
ncbi:magnesium-translocating P-type ATPase [Candidatus Nitrosotalea bavarica]|uniref:magnesium-translocating P-type ATPase n=1 Tax=Candidatus Nitrosotalea bavarica TaxID=1903277 RepID=UPI000C708C75|nr:magnesium-translocating P-type ATPase [Candidatus Nitrosotalea bavarica]